MGKLPKNPRKGETAQLKVKAKNGPRIVTFKATGKKGFGKWTITSNRSAR